MSRGMIRSRALWSLALALVVALVAPPAAADDADALSVQITSPLGRTGIPGTIRIVARVRNASRPSGEWSSS